MRRLGLWLLLCSMLLTVALPAWAAPRVEMTVQAANEGRIKQGGWVTVVVDLANQGGEISGQLVVEFDSEIPHTQYVVPYTLPAGGRKRIPVSLESSSNWPISVKLYADGALVKSEDVALTWLPPAGTLVGVLSSDELGIPGLSQLQSFQVKSAQVVRLSEATFPDRAALLTDFDVIALSRFDSSSLSPEQLRALEVWVGRGGTLLLGGGPEWKRTLSALPAALVPVEVTGVTEVDLEPLGELAGRPLTGTGAVSAVQTRNGQALISAGSVPLVVSGSVGSGRVIFLAFDPGLNPVVSWQGQAQFFNRLVGGAATSTKTFMGRRDWMLREALERLPDWGLPTVWTVGLLLGSYLLLIGPVNYLILKRMDKREWGWVSVPALSVLFVGAIYLIGFGRYQPLVSHLITVTELAPGTGSATMDSYLGIYAPSRERLSVAVENARLVKPIMPGSYRNADIVARVVAGEKTTVELMGLSNYSMTGFSMQHDIAVRGGLELVDAQLENGVLSARLINRLDQAVDDVYAVVGGSSQAIGRLEPGQTSDSFLLRPGATLFDPRMGTNGLFASRGSGNEPDDYRRTMIRDYVIETAAQRLGSGVMLFGWTEQPLVAPSLPDLGKMAQGANLVWSILSVPVGGDSAEIPAGTVIGRPVDTDKVDWLPSGYVLRPGTHDFTLLLPPIEAAKVGTVDLDLRQTFARSIVSVSVKNQQSGEYLRITSQTFPLSPWQEFVSPVGLIELRYEATEHMEILPPTVTVKGVRR